MLKRKYKFLIGASIFAFLSVCSIEISCINSKIKIKRLETTIKKNNESMNLILDSNKEQTKKIDSLQKQIKELRDKNKEYESQNKKLQEQIKKIGEPMDF